MTCLDASCFRLGLEMEVPSPARKSSFVVLLARANLGSAGNLVETPWEIFTLLSCIKSSTWLQNPPEWHLDSLSASLGKPDICSQSSSECSRAARITRVLQRMGYGLWVFCGISQMVTHLIHSLP